MAHHYLSPLFAPESIAVFGASSRPDSVGGRVFENLLSSNFKGEVFPINPKRKSVRGKKCYPDIVSLGRPIDLAVIATPAATVPAIIEQCGKARVPVAIVMSAGFGEAGKVGRRLQKETLSIARRYKLRILGPNCLGLVQAHIGLNATFSKSNAQAGDLALISQSGALCTAILDWAASQGIGFSTVVSLGDAADIGFGELLDYLAVDHDTRSILVYIEGIHHARSFLSGLRVAARLKPVIVMKTGRHEAGSRAAASHTGAMVGANDVFDAALERAGVVRAGSIEELFSAARILSSDFRVKGNGLAIISNAGGPGVIAADFAIDRGLRVPNLEPATLRVLAKQLPSHWSHGNPVDILGDATVERYQAALDACLADKQMEAVLVILTPQAMTNPVGVAKATIRARQATSKPVLACWMGGDQVAEAQQLLLAADVPTFATPESAVAAFSHLFHHYHNQQLMLEVPAPLTDGKPPDVQLAQGIIKGALAQGRRQLTAMESKRILDAFQIPVIATREVKSATAAIKAADGIGYPVVLKISSPELTHKTDFGGVELNLADQFQVKEAYRAMRRRISKAAPQASIHGVTVEPMFHSKNGRELLVGVINDPVFGPAMSFGMGGVAVEVFRDRAIALPPLNEILARVMISRTKMARLLGAFRGLPPVDEKALIGVLLRISELVCLLPEVSELDINPLVADENGVIALDARIVLAPFPESAMPFAHMAIHPYPGNLVTVKHLPDGAKIVIRPIRPEDAQAEQAFVRELSAHSRYFRFMHSLQELTPKMLVRFTQTDYDREMAFIATTMDCEVEKMIGVARYTINPDNSTCDFAIVVTDAWQGRGIASLLMNALIEEAKSKGLVEIGAEVLFYNHRMLDLARQLGFTVNPNPEDSSLLSIRREL